MLYKGFEIDTTTYPFISVFYCGDDLVFDSIADAQKFIDELEKEN